MWSLPYLPEEYNSLLLQYFSHLIGHEGENSLLSYLKREDYAMSLWAGGFGRLNCFCEFTVGINLTKKGLDNTDKVVDAIFTYTQHLL